MSPAKVESVAAGGGCSRSYKEIGGLGHQTGLFRCLAGVRRKHSFGCWTGSV